MPTHHFTPTRGRFETLTITSEALADNLLGDPDTRQVLIYLPEGYDDSDDDYPLIIDLAGYTSSGFKHAAWKAFDENLPQRVDRLVREGAMGPVVLAMPDAFTTLGGNQYINSPAMGRWADFLRGDMIDAIEAHVRVRRGREHRALFGKSSGGYGALVHAMRYPESWGAVASHAGDAGFEWVYLPDFPRTLTELARHGGAPADFLDQVATSRKLSGSQFHTLMTLGMAATYDPDPDARYGVRLPVDLRTCALIDERWQRWLSHDPVRIVDAPEAQDGLRQMRGVFIDVGSRDQYHIQYGTRAFVEKLEAADIPHHFEEFDGTHSGIDHRLDVSLPFLYDALTSD